MHKHFIDLDNLNKVDLLNILDLAREIKNYPMKFCKSLERKSLGMIFEKQSTRTRVSFAIGMQMMGGKVIELNAESIGFGSRESDSDLVKVLSQYLSRYNLRCSPACLHDLVPVRRGPFSFRISDVRSRANCACLIVMLEFNFIVSNLHQLH